ncbi:hypothetical protein M0813_28452 [Anaeramoeba flamelloides]|uniref:Uncharacterized protein n=1 Tax=Anaeramoeba flamelloides TaxID=1746091 RepID=A0ABQ8XU66_9EUKA|nr:hypothetical protein M0813_28452 [Anaeramoeba flamelloides]
MWIKTVWDLLLKLLLPWSGSLPGTSRWYTSGQHHRMIAIVGILENTKEVSEINEEIVGIVGEGFTAQEALEIVANGVKTLSRIKSMFNFLNYLYFILALFFIVSFTYSGYQFLRFLFKSVPVFKHLAKLFHYLFTRFTFFRLFLLKLSNALGTLITKMFLLLQRFIRAIFKFLPKHLHPLFVACWFLPLFLFSISEKTNFKFMVCLLLVASLFATFVHLTPNSDILMIALGLEPYLAVGMHIHQSSIFAFILSLVVAGSITLKLLEFIKKHIASKQESAVFFQAASIFYTVVYILLSKLQLSTSYNILLKPYLHLVGLVSSISLLYTYEDLFYRKKFFDNFKKRIINFGLFLILGYLTWLFAIPVLSGYLYFTGSLFFVLLIFELDGINLMPKLMFASLIGLVAIYFARKFLSSHFKIDTIN